MMATPLIGVAEPDFSLSASSTWAQTPAAIDHMEEEFFGSGKKQRPALEIKSGAGTSC